MLTWSNGEKYGVLERSMAHCVRMESGVWDVAILYMKYFQNQALLKPQKLDDYLRMALL
jgi:hypothetical protein